MCTQKGVEGQRHTNSASRGEGYLRQNEEQRGGVLMHCTNHTKQADQGAGGGADHFTGDPDPVHQGFPGYLGQLKNKMRNYRRDIDRSTRKHHTCLLWKHACVYHTAVGVRFHRQVI